MFVFRNYLYEAKNPTAEKALAFYPKNTKERMINTFFSQLSNVIDNINTPEQAQKTFEMLNNLNKTVLSSLTLSVAFEKQVNKISEQFAKMSDEKFGMKTQLYSFHDYINETIEHAFLKVTAIIRKMSSFIPNFVRNRLSGLRKMRNIQPQLPSPIDKHRRK